MPLTLVPAHGRDYKSKAAVMADWNANKNFVIANFHHPADGKYASKSDITETVNIRYKGLREICVIPYRPQGQSRVR